LKWGPKTFKTIAFKDHACRSHIGYAETSLMDVPTMLKGQSKN